MKRFLLTIFALAAIASMLPAQTPIIYTFSGTIGPVESGADPLGLSGQAVYVTAAIAADAKPRERTRDSATYVVSLGGLWLDIGDNMYTYINAGEYASIWKVTVTLGPEYDTLVLCGNDTELNVIFAFTAKIATGSWTTEALSKPMPFTPTLQTVAAPHSVTRYAYVNGPSTETDYIGTLGVN